MKTRANVPCRVKIDYLRKSDRCGIIAASINFHKGRFTMSAAERNFTWVRDHAYDIGSRKSGLASHCFTVGEVVEALGFSRNTVKKYVKMMLDSGLIREVVLTKKITIYRFNKSYIENVTGVTKQ